MRGPNPAGSVVHRENFGFHSECGDEGHVEERDLISLKLQHGR